MKLNADLDLILNKNVLNRKTINNSITKFQTMKSFSKDFIVVNGYHIFLPDALNKFFNIKIFLDPEPELNKNWLKNKINSQTNLSKIESYKELKKYQDLYSEQKNLETRLGVPVICPKEDGMGRLIPVVKEFIAEQKFN